MAKDQFTDAQKEAIINAIKTAENNTSGEIQVHIENHCTKDVMERAKEVFNNLKMYETAARNGVLFYLAMKDHKFAILGDAGINAVVPPDFWENIKNQMRVHFKAGRFTEGLCEGIHMAGDKLKEHFPYQDDDRNELPDDISFE
ncbi:MAG TPA: TPM domain-containing protein [Cytophagaceae bacterium]